MRPPHLGPGAFVSVPAPCPLQGMWQAGGVWRVWRALPTCHTANGMLCSLGSCPEQLPGTGTSEVVDEHQAGPPALVSRGSTDLQQPSRGAAGRVCLLPQPGCSGQSHVRPARWVSLVRRHVCHWSGPGPARLALVCMVRGGLCLCVAPGGWSSDCVCGCARASSSGGPEVIGAGRGVCVRVETEAAGLQTLRSSHHTWAQFGVWAGRGERAAV